MAGEQGNEKPSGSPEIETGVGVDKTTSINLGQPGVEPEANSRDDEGFTIEIDETAKRTKSTDTKPSADQEQGSEGDGEGEPEGDDADKGEEGDKEADTETTAEALPEFDAEKPEVVEAYEKAYVKEDGSLNMDRLSAEWWSKATWVNGVPQSDLPAGTYEYLASRGIDKASVKRIEAGQAALQAQATAKVIERAGGAEKLDAAKQWAKGGGYSKAQQEKYNRIVNGTDEQAINDEIDLLMSRFEKGTGGTTPKKPPVRKSTQTAPTSSAGATEGYRDHKEWRKAAAAARKAGDDRAFAEVRRRLQASSWYDANKPGG